MKATILFEHVPKAAGSTLLEVLSRQYSLSSTFNVNADSSDEALRIFNRFKAMPVDKRRRFDLIAGHDALSLLDYIPGDSVGITFLRDPVERVISHHSYVRRRPDHPLHAAAMDLDLGDYALSIGELTNYCTRQFSRLSPARVKAEPEAALAAAKQNLKDYFLVIGLSERFDESLILLANRLGWKRLPFYQRMNVTGDRPRRKEVSDRALGAIREVNALDVRLYDFVSQWFQEAVEAEGPAFSKKLRHFRRLNLYYQWFQSSERRRRLFAAQSSSLLPRMKAHIRQGYDAVFGSPDL